MITIILIRSETPANIGFISRVMANFDVSKLILIDPQCDHLDDEALKISMHSKNILLKASVKKYEYFDKLNENFDLVIGTTSVLGSDYNIPRTPLLPDELFNKIGLDQNIALVFGNEGDGLSNSQIRKCDLIVSIPTSKNYSAMNISHAVAVILYEMYKITGEKKITSHIKKASSEERRIMLETLDEIMNHIEFSTNDKKINQKNAWKNIFEKSMMSKREAFTIIGLLNKIKQKFNKS